MKKYFLLATIILQVTLLFGQTPLKGDNSLDPNIIFYDGTWGNWTTIGNSTISYTAKLKFFDKSKNMYGWDLKFKTNRTPIDFEFKITNGYVNGSEEIDKFFSTTIFDNKSNDNRANGSGLAVYSKSSTLTVAIRNICFDFDQDKNPKCQKLNQESLSSSGVNGQKVGTNTSKTETIVNTGIQLVNLGIELFGKHTETEPKFNGNITEFIQSNLNCPTSTLENVSVKVDVAIENDGSIDDRFSNYYTEYRGPKSNEFIEEIKRVIGLTKGMWTPSKYDGENAFGHYKFNVKFECINNSLVKKLSIGNKTVSQLTEDYIDFFENYSKEFKYVNSATSEQSVILNFNVFSIEIPFHNNKPVNYSKIQFNDAIIDSYQTTFSKLSYNEQINSIFNKHGNFSNSVKQSVVFALKTNNTLYSFDKNSFYIYNNSDELKSTSKFKVFTDDEKKENLKLIIKQIKKSGGPPRVINRNEFEKDPFNIFLNLIYQNGTPEYSFDYKITSSQAKFTFYFKNSYDYFKSTINLEDEDLGYDDGKLIITIDK